VKKTEVMKACDDVIVKGESFLVEAKKFIECVDILLIAAKKLRDIIGPEFEEDDDE